MSNSQGQQRSYNEAYRQSRYNLGRCHIRIGHQDEKQVTKNQSNVKGKIETGLRPRQKNRIHL